MTALAYQYEAFVWSGPTDYTDRSEDCEILRGLCFCDGSSSSEMFPDVFALLASLVEWATSG